MDLRPLLSRTAFANSKSSASSGAGARLLSPVCLGLAVLLVMPKRPATSTIGVFLFHSFHLQQVAAPGSTVQRPRPRRCRQLFFISPARRCSPCPGANPSALFGFRKERSDVENAHGRMYSVVEAPSADDCSHSGDTVESWTEQHLVQGRRFIEKLVGRGRRLTGGTQRAAALCHEPRGGCREH